MALLQRLPGSSGVSRVQARDVKAAAITSIGRAGVSAALAPVLVADIALASDASVDAVSMLSEYPLLASAAAIVAIGGVAVSLASSGKPRSQTTGAAEAYEALKAEERTVLVDLRPKSSLKEEGVVDLKEANKKVLSLVYAQPEGEEGDLAVDPEFAAKLQELAGVTAESIVILIDSDGSLAPKAAAAVAASGFFSEKVYWVRDGVEGPRGWKASDLPTKPYRVFELSLPNLDLPAVDLGVLAAELQAQLPGVDVEAAVDKVSGAVNTLTDKYKENPTVANGVLAAVGIAAVGAFAITEFEAIIEVLGALGLARFLATNLLFAKDREATLAAVREFLDGRRAAGGAAAADSSSRAAAGSDAALQQLTDIVMGARNAESAAQQISDQMVPEVKGVNVEALAAALAAAGVELPLRPTPAPQAQADAAPIWADAEAVVLDVPADVPLPEASPAPVQAEPVPVLVAVPAEEVVLEHIVAAAAGAEEVVLEHIVAAAAGAEELEVSAGALVPENVLQARDWIAAWKEARQRHDALLAEGGAAVAIIGGDGASESDPVEAVAVEAAAVGVTVSVPA